METVELMQMVAGHYDIGRSGKKFATSAKCMRELLGLDSNKKVWPFMKPHVDKPMKVGNETWTLCEILGVAGGHAYTIKVES